jgi:hypothetical protein
LLSVRGPTLFGFLAAFFPVECGGSFRLRPGDAGMSPFAVGSDDVGEMVLLSYGG